MQPDELAEKHPVLYHTTAAANWEGIQRHGLQSTKALLGQFKEADEEQGAFILRRDEFIRRRRTGSVILQHPEAGTAVITDNTPLHERKLAACLDDGLTPGDWLAMLNARVFFWTTQQHLHTLLHAAANRGQERLVLEFDTRKLAEAYRHEMEISPINTGATIHQPARRGLATFAPIPDLDFKEWRWRRGKKTPDSIKEVTILGDVPDFDRFLIRAYTAQAGKAAPAGAEPGALLFGAWGDGAAPGR